MALFLSRRRFLCSCFFSILVVLKIRMSYCLKLRCTSAVSFFSRFFFVLRL